MARSFSLHCLQVVRPSKRGNGQGLDYALVTYETAEEAQEAINAYDSSVVDGQSISVSLSISREIRMKRKDANKKKRAEQQQQNRCASEYRQRTVYDTQREREREYERRPRSSPGEYEVSVSGIPELANFQDLKDFMRCENLSVLHTEVYGSGEGIALFETFEDMKYAIDNLDNVRFLRDGPVVRVRQSGGTSRGGDRYHYSPNRARATRGGADRDAHDDDRSDPPSSYDNQREEGDAVHPRRRDNVYVRRYRPASSIRPRNF